MVGGLIAVAALVFVFVYFEPHTAFIDDRVDESIPGLDAVLATDATAPSSSQESVGATEASDTTQPAASTPETSTPENSTPANSTPANSDIPETSGTPGTVAPTTSAAAPANSIAAGIATAASTGQPVVLSTGSFFSGEHSTTGTALVVVLPDGSLVVRFEGLDTSNGPDLRVVVSPDVASESWEYSDRLILDELKGNIGDQNYVLGAGVDLTRYHSVVIWCERFSVAFGAAEIDVTA